MSEQVRLSAQQQRILQMLWRDGEASAKQVQQALNGELAHTTVGTMLSRLEKKGVLASDVQGARALLPAAREREGGARSMVSDLVSTMFKGDPKALVAHLVRESDIAADDLEAIRRMLAKGARK